MTGSVAEYIYMDKYDEHRFYSSLGDITQKRAIELIVELLKRGYLKKGGGRLYPVIQLTENGRIAIIGKKKIMD